MRYETQKNADIRKTNPNGTGYGRIAYNKASENEKRISADEKREILDEAAFLSETETINLLYGDVLQKGMKFEADGDKATFTFSATFDNADGSSASGDASTTDDSATDDSTADGFATDGTNSVTAEIYLNGTKICEKGDGDFPLTCDAKTKNGENVVYAIVSGATSNMTVTLTVTGYVKKTNNTERIYYLGSDFFAVSRNDALSVYKYADGQFAVKFHLCGLTTSSATYSSKETLIYVSGKRFSGTRFIFKVNPTSGETTLMDDSLDYTCGALLNNVKFRFYFLKNNYMHMATLSGNKIAVAISRTPHISEVYASFCDGGGDVITKDVHGNLLARKTVSGMLSGPTTMLGKAVAPELRYTDRNVILFRTGDDENAKTCAATRSDIRLLPGKVVYDRYPVAESETIAAGLEDGKPVVIQTLQQ